ncbi:MAG: hypothetical protein AABY15_07450 [Nanoarchaeota archaeon]
MTITRDERTRFNLENYLKMVFHPEGYRRFMERRVYDLYIKSPEAEDLVNAAIFADYSKYVLLGIGVAVITYELIK